jgi:alanyl-tRNA synthetase
MPQFLSTDTIRQRWIDFFVARNHKHISSDLLVPQNDPSVLFTGAGMNQFKDHFLGRAKIDHPVQRATTVQKCIRTGDIDNVGRTPSHHTFFEMLGNFSFGDYFKKEAIEWAWQFCTDPAKGLGLEKERLSVTIYGGNPALKIEADAEAEKWWQQFAPELKNADGSWRIYKYGDKDNYWPANAPTDGPNGPSGPCSEIYYDTKPEQGAPEPVADSKDPRRYVEIWNLVFTQFNRVDVGKLEPLGRQNIDTGAGLERMARVIQGNASDRKRDVLNNYEIDLLFPIVEEVARIAGKKYESASDDGRRMRRITDHTRAAVFCIADGVAPKNEGRNYVVRRLMRRAILDGRELGIMEAFLVDVAKAVMQQMRVGYPELSGPREANILKGIEDEEAAFSRTLQQGRQVFADVVDRLKKEKKKEIPGAEAFKLWDTYGFPYELTGELAESAGLTVDEKGYKLAFDEAVKRSQAGSTMSKEIFESGPVAELKKQFAGKATKFLGYESLSGSGKVLAIVQGNETVETAQSGDALVLLDQTPFYAESGGQVGDKGRLNNHAVLDTHKSEGLFLHRVKIDGSLKVGETVRAEVAPEHRIPTLKNHSGTHLLHHVLRENLGTHVEQRGSYNGPDRLRFDFTHAEQIRPAQLEKIEAEVNALIAQNVPVVTEVLPIAEAKKKGAMMLFGEKYGDTVRVVTMGPSVEFCGGTHVKTTGEIGYCRIVSEGSVSAGVRRIEALTGAGAVADARHNDSLLGDLALLLKTKKEAVKDRFVALQEEKAGLERELESLKKKLANAAAGELLGGVKEVKGAKFLAAKIEGADTNALRATLDGIRKNLKDGAIVLAGSKDGKVALLISLSPELVARGAHAGNILKEIAPKVGGKGGGKPEMAQGGGQDPSGIDAALSAVEGIVGGMLR